jgi:hypothetical protein
MTTNEKIIIANVAIEMKNHFLSSELKYLLENEPNSHRIEQIQKLLNVNTKKTQTPREELSQSLYNSTYMKPWKKLNIVNKIEKLNEYANQKNNIHNLLDVLDITKNHYLTKDTVVIYDQQNTKIIDIPSIVFNEELKMYEFVKVKKNIKQE